jgi:hypothetical protein
MILLRNIHACAWSAGLAAAALVAAHAARADVTVVEDTTINAAIVKMHTSATERTTRDKQRRDSDGKVDGMLSMLAGSMRTGDIIRLDRDLEWRLEPDKKKYLETPFPTAQQRALAQQKMQETLEKMQQCPAGPAQTQPAADSGCEKTEPKFNVSKTDDSAVIAGHTARKTLISMTYSCKDVKTGDTCDFVASSELWLSQEPVEGYDEKSAFAMEHAKKLGLDQVSGAMKAQAQMVMAPYMDQLKQLSSHAGDLKGIPLRTVFAVSVGGPQCSKARNGGASGSEAGSGSTVGDAGAAAGQAAAGSSTSAATSTAESKAGQAAGNGVGGQILGNAAGAFTSKLLGGLMSKKSDSKPAATPAAATAGPNMLTLMSMQTEVKSISTDAIDPSVFDLPPGWQKIEPKQGKSEEFQCPKTGT